MAIDLKIGSEFFFGGTKLLVVKGGKCENCFFHGKETCEKGSAPACSYRNREDKTNVMFVKSHLPDASKLPPPENPQKSDCVNHPKHYTNHPSGVECIQVTEHMNFCVGNAVKYLWRAGEKHEEGMTDREKQIEDLKKAEWYIHREIKRLQNEQDTEKDSE